MNINGFTLKGVKQFKGHEGEPCYQGYLYLRKQKVGWFSSSYTMGPMDIHFDSPEIEKAFTLLAETFQSVHPYGFLRYNYEIIKNEEVLYNKFPAEAEDLIIEMLTIIDIEKNYKKALKQGNKMVVYTFCNGKTYCYRFKEIIDNEKIIAYFKNSMNSEVLLCATSEDAFSLSI